MQVKTINSQIHKIDCDTNIGKYSAVPYNATFRVHRNELNYKWIVFYKGIYRKMTILWSFSYSSFVKFDGKKWEPQHDYVVFKSVL